MGLDMYLRGKRPIGWDDRQGPDSLSDKIGRLLPELGDPPLEVSEVAVEVGYWRKANAVHRWFVATVQGGVDDCGYYRVERGDLETLRRLCVEILADPGQGKHLLPTVDGFFFGDTGYGDGYMRDIQETLHITDRALLLPIGWEFEYHSSW